MAENCCSAFKIDFPGNIRELRNILSAAVSSCQNNHISLQQLQHIILPKSYPTKLQPSSTLSVTNNQTEEMINKEHKSLANIEQEQIALLLKQFSGNRKQVASHLGISVRTLYRKLNKYAIK